MTSEITAMMIDEAAAPPALLLRVASDGAAIVPLAKAWSTTPELLREAAAASPFAFATRLLGAAPLYVERQPIRPIDGGRSFASGRGTTPLHTDSQMFLGMPAAIQILICVKPAPSGGESVLLDGSQLLMRLEQREPALATALFEVERRQRFYFGEVTGPTIALRGGHLTWTCAPLGADPGADRIADALAGAASCERELVHALRPGEALVASNHRMLHGRRPFEGERELVRLLVWLEQPLPAEPRHVARAKTLSAAPSAMTLARLRAVLALLRGVPPAKVATEAGVTEAVLYGWRDAFMSAGAVALRS